MSLFLMEFLYRRLVVDEGDDYIAVVGVFAFVDYEKIAVKDPGVDHAFALDVQSEKVRFIVAPRLKINVAVDILLRQYGQAGGDVADDRHAGGRGAVHSYRAAFALLLLNIPHLFKTVKVQMHGGRAFDAERRAYVAHARRITLVRYRVFYIVEHFLLKPVKLAHYRSP